VTDLPNSVSSPCLRCWSLLLYSRPTPTTVLANHDARSLCVYNASAFVHRVSKNSQNCFCYNFVQFLLTLTIFGRRIAKTIELCKVHSFTKTQMLKIVTLHGSYLYRIAYLCIINSTEGATWFNNFVVLSILWQNSRQQNS